jgi:hypothetical protein
MRLMIYEAISLPRLGIALSVPVTQSEELAPQIVQDYWDIRAYDADWNIYWENNVSMIAQKYRATEDAIRIISHEFPQVRLEGHLCVTCHKDFRFTSRSQFGVLLKKLRDGESLECDYCREAARDAARKADAAIRREFYKEHPWTLSPNHVREIRRFTPAWGVHETIAARLTTCRECGLDIRKGEPRLSFMLAAPEGQERKAHIHRKRCTAKAEQTLAQKNKRALVNSGFVPTLEGKDGHIACS